MSAPARQIPEFVTHSVRWDAEEFQRIRDAAATLSAEQGLDLTPTAVIRKATRALLDQMEGDRNPPQSSTERRTSQRRIPA